MDWTIPALTYRRTSATGGADRTPRHLPGILMGLATLWIVPTIQAERTLVQETVINAPVAAVWDAFTDEVKARSWAAPKTKFDIRVGGEMRSSYDANSSLDDDQTIVNKILCLEPQRMIAIQNVKAPKGFPHADLFAQTWSVIYFEPLGPARTRLRSVGLGYGEGADWDVIYGFFDKGNAQVYGALKKLVENSPAASSPDVEKDSADATMKLLATLVGQDWVHEAKLPNGSIFRVRSRLRNGPGGHSIVTRGWLGNADGMSPHGAGIVFRAPGTGKVRFINLDEGGSVAKGEIKLADPQTLVWDWRSRALSGETHVYAITMKVISDQEYQFELKLVTEDGGTKPLVSATFRRVASLPAGFELKGQK